MADSHVAWAKVGSIVDGKITYRVAVAFDQPMTGLAPAATGADQEERQGAALPRAPLASPVSTDAPSDHPEGPAVAAGLSASPDADASGDVTVAAGQTASDADAPVQASVPARDNLARFPSAAARSGDEPRSAEGFGELAEPCRSIAEPVTRGGDVQPEVAAGTAEWARQSTVSQSPVPKLGEPRTGSRGDPEAERRRWEEERSAFLRQMANAVAALQTALDTRAQEQLQSLAEQQGRYEALVAELVKTTNEQETEHQQLLDEMTAAHDEQRRRAEHYEVEVARQRAAVQQQRAESETRRRELEARVESAEALCAAHDARFDALRREAERLLSMCTTPLRTGSSHADELPFACETEEDPKRALA